MMRKPFSAIAFVLILTLLLAACGGAPEVNPPDQGPDAPPVADTPAPIDTPESDLPVPTEPPAAADTPTEPAAEAPTPVAQVETPQEQIPVTAQGFGTTLSEVQERGNLVCGINGQLPGFSFLDPSGNYSGFDVDFCRALAAAIFGDPDAVEYRTTNTQERFTVLQTGEVDVLIRNTTWSLVRDTELGLNFTSTTFYDGQGIMVPADSGLTTLQDLEGGTICVQRGTTTELNLTDVMATEGVNYTPAVFEDVNATYGAYAEGRCDAVTSDRSQLSSVARGVLPDPENHVIMDITISKEPLGPAVRHGDDQWFDIVNWTIFATIAGEEYGITSENAAEIRDTSENPEVRRLLGVEGELGQLLGLSNDFAFNAISMVGNYEEIYNRNLGEGTPTFIPRGLNSLYTDGGLLYSPPFR